MHEKENWNAGRFLISVCYIIVLNTISLQWLCHGALSWWWLFIITFLPFQHASVFEVHEIRLNCITRAWCTTIVTFFINYGSYTSFAPRPGYSFLLWLCVLPVIIFVCNMSLCTFCRALLYLCARWHYVLCAVCHFVLCAICHYVFCAICTLCMTMFFKSQCLIWMSSCHILSNFKVAVMIQKQFESISNNCSFPRNICSI